MLSFGRLTMPELWVDKLSFGRLRKPFGRLRMTFDSSKDSGIDFINIACGHKICGYEWGESCACA